MSEPPESKTTPTVGTRSDAATAPGRRAEESRGRILVAATDGGAAMAEKLRGAGYAVVVLDSAAAARESMESRSHEVAILDDRLRDVETLANELRTEWPDTVVLETVTLGPLDAPGMAAVSCAVEAGKLRRDSRHLRDERRERLEKDRLIGRDARMRSVLERARELAVTDAPTVLLRGESGTGKRRLARAIHVDSRRRERPLLYLACQSLTESRLGNEIFGYEKGAFPGATSRRRGILERAEGGTVVLDEIGDASPGFRPRFLAFLEKRTFRRVGGTADIAADLRIVATTSRDLGDDLSGAAILIPPLRDRRDDIAPLAAAFLEEIGRDLRKRIVSIDADAMAALEAYSWPGNVRELRNVVERGILRATSDRLCLEHWPREIRDGRTTAPSSERPPDSMPLVLPAGGVDFEEVEKELVKQALARTGGNQTRAATLLGMNRDQIRYRIEKFRLRDPATGE